METVPLTLSIERAWSEHAEAWLARAQARSTRSTAPIRRKVEQGAAELLVFRRAGKVVLVVAIEIEQHAHRKQLVILAAGGRLVGADLTQQLLPAIERLHGECDSARIQTARPGLKRKLIEQGYAVTHWIMEKRLAVA